MKSRGRFLMTLLGLALCCTTSALAQAPATQPIAFTVHTDSPIKTIDAGIYGQFLEHIYNSVHGGLWGDQILNGTLELRPPRRPQAAPLANPTFSPDAPFAAPLDWQIIGDQSLIHNEVKSPFSGQASIRLTRTEAGAPAGIRQSNISLRAGERYSGSIHLRGSGGPLRLEFTDPQGNTLFSTQFSELKSDWTKRTFEFSPDRTVDDATLTISLSDAGDVSIDDVSMFSASALAAAGFRPDLLKAVADLHPASIRWPGGSYANTYIWQNGVGPREKRLPHPVEAWNDRDPNYFGTDEFLQLCEKLGAEPILVLNTARGVNDALDWLEYCTGDANSTWGKLRAANGHPQPYTLETIEIDNETWLLMDKPAYVKIVREFAPAIRAKYPKLKISICGAYAYDTGPGEGKPGNANWDQTMLDEVAPQIDILSVHYYNGLLREHPADYVSDPRKYEAHLVELGQRIKRSANPNIKIYVSEWNLTSGAWGNDWRVGLYAGAILNAFEREADLVKMSCPALFLRRTSARAWNNALINFDQSRWFPAGNYVVMKLFRDSFAPGLLKVDGPEAPLDLTATQTADGRTLYLKLVNPTSAPIEVSFVLDGAFILASASMQLIAPGSETARNTLDNSGNIEAKSADVQRDGRNIRLTMPAWSVGAVKLEGQ